METSGDFPPGLALPGIPSGGFISRTRISRLKLLPDPAQLPASHIGAPMEDLIELVAASFARHGIETPAGDPQQARPISVQTVRPAEPTLTTALPEHNYRKGSQEICP